MTRPTLAHHLETAHNRSHLSNNLKEIVYGGIDGIITTFAVVAGFSGAAAMGNDMALPVAAVLLFGLANLFADGFSMGISDFLSSRAERKLYEKERGKERREITSNPASERAESLEILESKDFSKEDAAALVAIYSKNPTYWTDFMMRYELEMPEPDDQPWKGALFTFFSFLMFGALPLVPYMFGLTFLPQFVIACIFGGVALALLGVLRAQFTQENTLLSMGEIVGLGAVAATIAYTVGTFFGG